MTRIIFAAGFALAALNAFALNAKSYIQSGMVLQLDAIANLGIDAETGEDRHGTPGKTGWVDLANGSTMAVSKSQFYWTVGENYMQFPYPASSYGTLSATCAGAITAIRNRSVTVQILEMPIGSVENGGHIQLQSGNGLYLKDATSSPVNPFSVLAYGGRAETLPKSNAKYLNKDVLITITVDPQNGASIDFNDGPVAHTNPGGSSLPTSSQKTVNICGGTGDNGHARFRSLRIYNRVLTPSERVENAIVDAVRYFGKDEATVRGLVRAGENGTEVKFVVDGADPSVEYSIDGGTTWAQSIDTWREAGELVTLMARSSTPGVRFGWSGLGGNCVLPDDGTDASVQIMLNRPLFESISARAIAANATLYWAGGSGVFADPEKWLLADGSAAHTTPSEMSDVVVTYAVSSGSTDTITVRDPIRVKSLTVGGGAGEGECQLVFEHPFTNEVVQNVLVRSRGTISHQTGGVSGSVYRYKLCLEVGGNMTVESGGAVSANGAGFGINANPYGSETNTGGGAPHGGCGFSGSSAYRYAYDSALEPTMPGSGGYSGTSQGGGIIRLVVTGNLAVGGSIAANGLSNTGGSYGGAGGAVWIDCGRLMGEGTISANGGNSKNGRSGHGGRIAVYETGSQGTDFSAFTGNITAYGGYQTANDGSLGKHSGAAGTVYLQAYGQTVTNATLVIDNKNVLLNSKSGSNKYLSITPLHESFGTAEIGNLVLRNAAHASISNRTMLVHGSIIAHDGAPKFEPYSGDLQLVGPSNALLTGTCTYSSLTCTAPGKRISFGTGETNCINIASTGTLVLAGEAGNNLVLTTAVPGESWHLAVPNTASYSVQHVTVDHSDASGGQGIMTDASTDAGDNVNWSFPATIEPGDPITWNGTVDTSGSGIDNWTDKFGGKRVPVETDRVIIPGGCENYPVFAADTMFNSITIESGASLTFSGSFTYCVTNGLSVAGTLRLAGTAVLDASCQSVDFTGGALVSDVNAKFLVSGNLPQTVNLNDSTISQFNVAKNGGSVAFTGGFHARLFDVASETDFVMTFADGVSIGGDTVLVRSRSAEANIDLVAANAGDVWTMNLTESQFFSGIRLSGCTAAGTAGRAGNASTDLGGNSNWTFGASVHEWIGGTGSFEDAANWYPATVPGAASDVVIASCWRARSVTAAGNVSVRSVTIAGDASHTSTLRVNGVFSTAQDLVVATNATLTLTAPVATNIVGRDFIMKSGATAGHPALPASMNTIAEADASGYRFSLRAERDIVIEEGAQINVKGMGYAARKGPTPGGATYNFDLDGDGEYETSVNCNTASHGGSIRLVAGGEFQNSLSLSSGSMFLPRTHGSGGGTATADGGRGGGVVLLACGRDMTLGGNVNADGTSNDNGSGAGGSVLLDVEGILSLSGNISADGARVVHYRPGGGGRIAIYAGEYVKSGLVTTAVRYTAYRTDQVRPGPGTVLVKLKGSEFYDVTILDDNYVHRPTSDTKYLNDYLKDTKMGYTSTDVPAPDDEDKISLFKRVRFSIGNASALNLRSNLKVRDIAVNVNTAALVRLNGYTMRVLSKEHEDARGWAASYEAATRVRGEILWPEGFIINVR